TFLLHRGTHRAHARALVYCLLACALTLAPLAWGRRRFDVLGPTLSPWEIAFWLAWTALAGWSAPLGLGLAYVLRAGPRPVTASVPVPAAVRHVTNSSQPAAPNDPGRHIEPLGAGVAWGNLVPVIGIFAERTLALTRQTTILGRESDCDIVVPDDRASRYHAELRWDHGVASLVDRGSTNGTRVNGQRVIGQALLRDGDVLAIGAHHYRFQLVQVEPSEPTDLLGESGGLATSKVPGVAGASGSRPSRTSPIIVVAETGAARGRHWELRGQISVIGRGSEYAVNLPDTSVSRPHAQLIWQGNDVYAQDLDSANGTRLNGTPLAAPARLREGDLLRVGEVTLRCVALGAATEDTLPVVDIASATTTTLNPVLDIAAAATTALNPVPAPPLPAIPDTHTLMAPRPRPADRPHLAPPRLLPSLDPPTPPDDHSPGRS
ncbi:MAG TPA: FHA domain-containing protein, partial [Ktedonobacterales bacterium]|nr:FHA domain-containing protein [Ktedonobacterales bacterium]